MIDNRWTYGAHVTRREKATKTESQIHERNSGCKGAEMKNDRWVEKNVGWESEHISDLKKRIRT